MRIILVHPEIPPNTGSIGRLCAATATPLILVRPLGFSLDDRYLKRAGLDYWPYINLTVVDHWHQALATTPGTNWLFTTHATRSYTEVTYHPDDALIFGCESTGLPPEVMASVPSHQHLRIPMDTTHVRSLNLAQCAALTLYETRRQLGQT